jgi:hypothetical protein
MSTGLFEDEEDEYNLEEEVKYKLKVAAPSTPPLPISEPEVGGEEDVNIDLGAPEGGKDDKPFDDTPFDAGVEANEDEDPEKYIQQLAGKLGTTLRKYTEDKGEPDFDLEKFAINSVISATHTAEMGEEDQKDIIKKIKSSGDDEKDINVDVNVDTGDAEEELTSDEEEVDIDTEDQLDEAGDPSFQTDETKSYFAPDAKFKSTEGLTWESEDLLSDAVIGFGSDVEGIMEEDHEEGHEGVGELKHNMFFNDIFSIYHSSCELLEMDANTVDSLLSDGHGWALDHIATANSQLEAVYHFLEGIESGINEGAESNNYMFFQNLKTMRHASHEILDMDVYAIDELLQHHEWALNLIARANDDVEEVYHFLMGALDGYDGETEAGYEDEYGSVESPEADLLQLFTSNSINEAEYKGKKVKLGKPIRNSKGKKKFSVYVKNNKGNVVKVSFGDPNMEIKRDDSERRKSFRARHKCSQAKDRTTPKYWSCKMWSKRPVSKIVDEDKKKSESGKIKGIDGKACWPGHRYGGTKNGKDICTKVNTNESLSNSNKNSIFVENDRIMILNKLNEMCNVDLGPIALSDNPVKEPVVLPETPVTKPSKRKERIWEVKPASKPKPKM